MKVLVCGGRDFKDAQYVADLLTEIHDHAGHIDEIIHGAARGADSYGANWAEFWGVTAKAFHADWSLNGRGAGPLRNQQMIDDAKPDLVLAFAGERGTDDMCRRAIAAGIEVRRYWPGKS